MNILILGNYPPPYGGVPHHIKLLSNYLVKNGNKVFVVAGGDGKIQKINNIEITRKDRSSKLYLLISALPKLIFLDILFKNGLGFSNLKYFIRLNIFYKIAQSIVSKNKIDIILSYNLYYYSPLAYQLYKTYKIPYIVNVFGEIYRLNELRNNKDFYLEILKSSKHNISCSLHCAKSIDLLETKSPILYRSILYGIDFNYFNCNNINVTQKNKIGFFGRIDTEMGVDIFQNIISKMSDYSMKYIIAGQKGNYHDQIEKFKSSTNFLIETYYNVDTVTLANLYKECKIVIVPTRGLRACSSLATMEAMACGCLVMGHNIGGIPELLNKKTGVLVDFENVEMFVNNIKYFLSNESELKQRIANSLEYASNNFNQEVMCDNFYKIISE